MVASSRVNWHSAKDARIDRLSAHRDLLARLFGFGLPREVNPESPYSPISAPGVLIAVNGLRPMA